jgi:hypothetical protein
MISKLLWRYQIFNKEASKINIFVHLQGKYGYE